MTAQFQNCAILIVGGAGFVGSNLAVRALAEQAASVTVVDNLLSADLSNLPTDDRIKFIRGSVADDLILKQIADEFDFIFHLATFHGNQNSIFNPIADHQNNTLTTLKLFNHIRDFKKASSIVYSGAGCAVAEKTFGVAHATEESDLVRLEGDSPYSLSKIFGEFYANYFFKQNRTPIVRARFQNVYGPREILGAGEWRGTPATIWRNVTPNFIWRAINNMPLKIENEGIATRDFIFVEDVVSGLIQIAMRGRPGDVYNLATGVELSIRELATSVLALTESHSTIDYLPRRSWDNSGMRFGDPKKTQRELGYSANTPLESGLRKTIEWTRANRSTIERCIAQHSEHVEMLS